MVKASTQIELERFFSQMGKEVHMSEQAFSLARGKIKWTAFDELFRLSVSSSYEEEHELWQGMLPLAIDSSEVALPRDKRLGDYYGTHGETKRPTGRVSLLYDVVNDIIVDGSLDTYDTGERSQAQGHIKRLKEEHSVGNEPIVLIFDRGYPSKDFLSMLEREGFHYVMRCSRSFNPETDRLTDGEERWVNLWGNKVRAYAFALPSGEIERLLTDLPEDTADKGALQELYWKRWPVETKYNQLKQKLQMENFNGRTLENIKQDFYGMLTVANMLASVLREANRKEEERRTKQSKPLKWTYKVNVNHAIGVFKDKIIKVLATDDDFIREALLDVMVEQMRHSIIPIRPNRNVPRLHKGSLHKPHFHHTIKYNC
jgi:hypothetical protein